MGEAALKSCLILLSYGLAQAFAGTVSVTDKSDTLSGYANLCYDAVGVEKEELEKIPDCTGTAESGAVQIQSHARKGGAILSDSDHNRVGKNPSKCDNPVWAESECYGNTWARVIPLKREGAYAVVLCRQGHRWSNDPENFSNISMILYNQNNGKTCFFTADAGMEEAPGPKSGIGIPALHSQEGKSFWSSPRQLNAQFGSCVRCHDSGPIMTDPWLWEPMTNNPSLSAKQLALHKRALSNRKNPYDPFVGEFFNKEPEWKKIKKNLKFVTVGKEALPPGARSCTSCHKIGTEGTCDRWIDNATGRFGPAIEKLQTPRAKKFPQSHWMPPDREEGWTLAEWEKTYGRHVELLKQCCLAARDGEAAMKKIPGCAYDVLGKSPEALSRTTGH